MVLFEFVTDAFAKAGHPLTLAQSGWISPADLMHMRIGDVSAFKPETQLQYAYLTWFISRRVALLV